MEGRRLAAGRNIDRPDFITLGGEPWVTYIRRQQQPTPMRSGTYDEELVRWKDGQQRTVMSGIVDRDSWRPRVDAAGIRYYMVDERLSEGAPPAGGLRVATLARATFANGEVLERIPDVLSINVDGGLRSWLYLAAVPGQRLPELRLRAVRGTERALGPSSGESQIVGEDRVYFVGGDDRMLTRLDGAEAPLEALRPRVTRFLLRDDERYAALAVADPGQIRTLVFNLETRQEMRLPGAATCCWLGFTGADFVYTETAVAGAPARMHSFNVQTGADRTLDLPAGLSDASSILARPGSDRSLFFDSHGRVAEFRQSDGRFRLLGFRPVGPRFTEDGAKLAYIDVDVIDPDPEGRLMLVDGDFDSPPRQLSPHGALVPQGGFFFLGRGAERLLVYWAHYGRNAADLYFGDDRTGESRVVASAISDVSVTPRTVFGIMRISGQDLVGELVNRDLVTGEEQVLAHRVSDVAVAGARLGVVIRDRVASSRDGLWATCFGPDEDSRRKCWDTPQ